MIIKTLRTEWFQDYKKPSMFIAFPRCSFKCEKECKEKVCQNSSLANSGDIDCDIDSMIEKYKSDPITKAIVCGGLDPMDSFNELYEFIYTLRHNHSISDTVVIYTGYCKEEIIDKVEKLKGMENIIVKFGRYIPRQNKKYDDLLGVWLASDNQYAEKIS